MIQVQQYERFTPLVVEPKGLPNGWADVTEGDCIVAFSRRAIYSIRKVGATVLQQKISSDQHMSLDNLGPVVYVY